MTGPRYNYERIGGILMPVAPRSFSGGPPFAFMKPPAGGGGIASPFITDAAPTGDSRSGSFWVGYRATNTDGLSHTISQLARWGVAGNSHAHEVRIVRVSDNVTISSCTVTASGATYVWGSASGTTAPSGVYYVAQDESAGLENWADAFVGGSAQSRGHTSAFSIDGPVYSTDGGATWIFNALANAGYGPPNFKYL